MTQKTLVWWKGMTQLYYLICIYLDGCEKKYMFSCSRQFRKALWACVTEIQGSYLLITLPMLLLTVNDKSYFQHLSACIWLHINRVSPPLACILQPTCFFLPLSFNIAICTAALSFKFTQSLRIDIITLYFTHSPLDRIQKLGYGM